MCTISMVSDGWREQFPQKWPNFQPSIFNPAQVTRDEFESLRREVSELKELLLAAKKFDAATGQPDCEIDEKVRLIREVAKLVGVDMNDVFGA